MQLFAPVAADDVPDLLESMEAAYATTPAGEKYGNS